MGIDGLDLDNAREVIYGEPYDNWKKKYQTGPKLPMPAAALPAPANVSQKSHVDH